MIYTSDQMIEDFRSDVFDKAKDADGNTRDTLWSDAEVLRYINTALARYAVDTLAFRQRFTIAFEGGKATAYFPVEILEEVRVDYTPTTTPPTPPYSTRTLTKFDIDEGVLKDDYGLRYITPIDMANRTGSPRWYTRDYDPNFLRIYPISPEPGSMTIYASVVPMEVQEGMPTPITSFIDRDNVMCYVKYLAYAKQDADTLDLRRSAEFKAMYDEKAGERRDQLDRDRRRGGTVASRWTGYRE